MPRRSADFDLASAVASPGFTPRTGDIAALVDLIGGEERTAQNAERALARLGLDGARAAIERFEGARPPLRSRLCRLIGRVAADHADAELESFLRARLVDSDRKTQRAAIVALGKIGRGLDALLELWDAGAAIEERRALATALGKSGDAHALSRLEQLETDDPELSRILNEARLKLGRTLSRAGAGDVDLDATPAEALDVVLHCRHGLESLLCEELPAELGGRVVGPGRVAATLKAGLRTLLTARIAQSFGFPLATLPSARDARELGAVVGQAIASERTWRVVRALTRGPPRYRIEWASAGRRRALTYRVAESVLRARPELVNDPRAAAWEIVVEERPRRIDVELRPRRFEDSRFQYRRRLLPAASHPTIAAALARVAGAVPDDVVWDPFVGTATELIERAQLGSYRALYGSDLDPKALDAARENLRAAGVRAVLAKGDARSHRPPMPPTLVLTNPPLGRRMLRQEGVAELYAATLAHVAELLVDGGRLVWISALPELTLSHALREGFTSELRQRVDMGGFQAEIQHFLRVRSPRHGSSTRRTA